MIQTMFNYFVFNNFPYYWQVMIVAGTITMKSQQSERNVTLDSSNPIAYLKVGALYHVFNSANVTAIYQLTETLKKL